MRAYLSRRIQAVPVHAHTSLCSMIIYVIIYDDAYMYAYVCIYDDAYMYAYVCKCVTQIGTH